jgi:phosphoglycolate phosphatase-like HAD superfamily hydrolase
MRFRNIIFDFDGTLTDSKHDIASAQIWVLHQLGVDSVQAGDLFRHIGKTLPETFTAVLPEHLHDRIPEAVRLYSHYYPPRSLVTTTLFPGVRETLQELVRRGARLAVASTKRGPGIVRATTHFGITDLFVQLQGTDHLPFKPDPAIIRKILTDQKWEQEETLMVGDTDKDILVGKNAGIATCAVTYGALTAEELAAFAPDYTIHRISEIVPIANGSDRIAP